MRIIDRVQLSLEGVGIALDAIRAHAPRLVADLPAGGTRRAKHKQFHLPSLLPATFDRSGSHRFAVVCPFDGRVERHVQKCSGVGEFASN